MRRPAIAALVLLLAALVGATGDRGPGARANPGVSPRPNIIVVIVDDQPALDGRLVQLMPNVKSLFVDSGVTFSDFHGETPLCCPARAGLLTGQHTHNHRVITNAARLFDPAMSIATQLAGVGYHTFMVGKYMNMYGAPSCNRPANCAPTIPPGWKKWAVFGDPKFYRYELWTGNGGAPAIPVSYGSAPEDYSTDVIKEIASELIRSAPRKNPLFGWIAPNAPHAPGTPAPRHKSAPCEVDPWQPPSWNEADVSDKPEYVRQLPLLESPARLDRYCRPLLAVDELVGEIKNALQATGRLNDTLFIYTGDNGMEMGEHRLPLKSAPYQTQVPFYARWPNALGTAPETLTERIQSIDVAPTLAELANTALGPFPNGQAAPDGLSFAPLLLGTASTLGRRTVLEEMLTDWRGVPEWNSVTTTAESPLASQGCAGASAGGCRWHYTEYPVSGEEELYDLSNGPCWEWAVGQPGDPCELGNRAANPGLANIKAALRAELARLKAEKGQ